MKKETILLTGATGFLGSHLLRALIENGYNVNILARSSSSFHRISELLSQVRVYSVDKNELSEAFEGSSPNILIHTACSYGRKGESIDQVINVNINFGLKLLELSKEYNCNNFLNTHTLLPKQTSSYALSKHHFKEYSEFYSSALKVIHIAPEHIYGPADDETKFINYLLTQLKRGVKRIALTEGNQKRNFIYVDDVVSAYLKIIDRLNKIPTETEYQVGTENSVSIRQFVNYLFEDYQIATGECNTIPGFGDLPMRKSEPDCITFDNQAIKELGWEPKTTLRAGLKKIIKEFL